MTAEKPGLSAKEGGGGWAPMGDLEKEFPPNFRVVALPELAGYADEYVLAWSEAEAAKREEIARVAAILQGRKPRLAGG